MSRSRARDLFRLLVGLVLTAWSILLWGATPNTTAPTVTLSISATTVALGSSATLTWSSTSASSCAFSGAVTGSVALSGSKTVKPTATGSFTYTLTCSGSGGSANKSVTLKVNPAPTVTLSVSPTSVVLGDSATLTWSSANTASCTFSGAYTGSVALSGSNTVKPTAVGNSTYTLTCNGPGGIGSASKSVTLKATTPPPPIVTFTISPAAITLGDIATLTWSSTYATSCAFTGSYTGNAGLQSNSSPPVTVSPGGIGSYSITLTCTGTGGTTAQTATLQVNEPAPPTVTLAISPASIPLGYTATLTWTSINATSCAMSGAYNGAVALQSSTTKPFTVKPAAKGSYSYTLACTGAGGTSSQMVTLQVTPPNLPSISLGLSPVAVPVGSSATLNWNAINASSCTFSGAYSGSVATQSSSTKPLTVKPSSKGNYTYTLTCSGSGGTSSQSATLPVLSTLDQKIWAAQQTALNLSPSSSCGAIDQNTTGSNDGFYWEIGNASGIITDSSMGLSASGSVQPAGVSGQNYTRSTSMLIDSGTKWVYASYIAEIKATTSTGTTWTMPSRYVPFLHFTSGYVNMSDNCNYIDTPTVQNCLDALNGDTPSVPNGTKTSADVGLFDYDSGHLEVLEAGADPTLTGYMSGGANNVVALASEVSTALAGKNVTMNFTFATPVTAGGIATTPGDYALFLQGLIKSNTPLLMHYFLNPTAADPYAVCTNPYDTTCVDSKGNPLALYSPLPGNVSWHYSLGHWIEDDPVTGDGAYSSPGKAGFYPWIDSTKTYYGMVARYDTNSTGTATTAPFYLSAVCGEAIRKAFMTGVVQP